MFNYAYTCTRRCASRRALKTSLKTSLFVFPQGLMLCKTPHPLCLDEASGRICGNREGCENLNRDRLSSEKIIKASSSRVSVWLAPGSRGVAATADPLSWLDRWGPIKVKLHLLRGNLIQLNCLVFLGNTWNALDSIIAVHGKSFIRKNGPVYKTLTAPFQASQSDLQLLRGRHRFSAIYESPGTHTQTCEPWGVGTKGDKNSPGTRRGRWNTKNIHSRLHWQRELFLSL